MKLVYLPNRANAKEWICILSTDTDMAEDEIIRQYGKHWSIEVLFKCSKQFLKFGKDFQSPSFEAQSAQIAIAFARYMLIATEQVQVVVDYVAAALLGYLHRTLAAKA